MDKEQELIPIEQQTLTFYEQPLVVVRLPDGRAGVVLRFLCENIQLETRSQIRRIQRTEAIADDLVYARIDTEGGPQHMAVLVLHAVPFWLAGIDPKRVREEVRPDILRYQREVVDVLYAWASAPKTIVAPANLVPAEPVTQPARPAPDASIEEWIYYHQQMLTVLEWQRDVERWRGGIETRLEGIEAIIPDILDRLGPPTLTPDHQNRVKYLVSQLNKATSKHPATIYSELYTAFSVPRYQELKEADWQQVEQWFQVQIDRARKR